MEVGRFQTMQQAQDFINEEELWLRITRLVPRIIDKGTPREFVVVERVLIVQRK